MALPVETFENIIDHLWDDSNTLLVCALVCRSWYPRSRLHLLGEICFYNQKQVSALYKLIDDRPELAHMVKGVVLRGSSDRSERKPVPHLTTFATMYARKLPTIRYLCIAAAECKINGSRATTFLRHISLFHSIATLELFQVTFPSLLFFGRFIAALPNLKDLSCKNVDFRPRPKRSAQAQTHNPIQISTNIMHSQDKTKLVGLDIDGPSMPEIITALLPFTFVRLEKLMIGDWYPVLVEDIPQLGIQQLFSGAGRNLTRLDLTSDSAGLEKDVIREIVESHLNLSENTSLAGLTMRISAIKPEDIDLTWFCEVLSHIKSTVILDLLFRFDIREATDPAVSEAILAALNSENCSYIDKVLCQANFAKLQQVNFQLLVAVDGPRLNWSHWHSNITARFPLLYKRNLVRPHVSIDA